MEGRDGRTEDIRRLVLMSATKIKIKNTIDTKWIMNNGFWHNVVDSKTVCSERYLMGNLSDYDDIDPTRVCSKCWGTLSDIKIGKEKGDIKFNTKIFGNERMLFILKRLKEGEKRSVEMKDLIEGTGKRHMDFEFTRLMDNGLIEKNELYYRLTAKGIIGEFIGSLILDLQVIDEQHTLEMVDKIRSMEDSDNEN